MSFALTVHPRAAAELDAIHESLSAYSEITADRTYSSIKEAIFGL